MNLLCPSKKPGSYESVTQREMCTLDVHERHKYDFCIIPHHSVPVINLFYKKSLGTEINYVILVDIKTHGEITLLFSAK